ncbi:M14 family zinc carboxypeptidase [Paraliomyxa miuraensis]|uniref:M14 family zinc carboxypeptidase n=1 Tax=Paraliomyxa miuraensis TaxID=376150 RepID=UPI0022529692|nr:M14 family zinc carboxypeptidase [Paraliomyxa miuraensis]MCX4246957.1 M14 family zinc carboxypeptidase [Paraliomyxa miuraensis]
MRSRIPRWLGLPPSLWLAASLWLAPSPATAFPDFDAKREEIVIGRVRTGDPAVAGTAETVGTFEQTDGVLRRAEAETVTNAWWLAKGATAHIGDGLVRFRIQPGKRADLGLMVRAHAGQGWDLVCGYELSVLKDKVRLMRWDRGVAKPMGDAVKIKGSPSTLEFVVHLVGPQLVATVYDGDKLTLLGTLTAHDTTYADGRVGVRIHAKAQGGALTLLSVMDTTRASKSGVGQHVPARRLYPSLGGPDRADDTTPFGDTRFAFIPHDQLPQLPSALRRHATGEHVAPDGTRQAVLELSTVQAEQLRRTDVTIAAIDGTAGWGLFDAAYRERRGKPPTPTARGFRVDESYKDPRLLEELLRAYHERYPEISELHELGRTHGGRPIWGLKISDHPEQDEDEPAVLFNAMHHASELLSTEYALDVVQGLLEGYGRDPAVTRWVDGLEIWCVPMVNPDGNAYFIERSQWVIRKNGRDGSGDGSVDPFEGVDLSRNYPFGWGARAGTAGSPAITSQYHRGPSPGSEPETQAMMALAQRQRFAASISFHTIGRVIYVPYNVDGTKNPRPNAAWTVAEELAAAAPAQRNGKPYRVAPAGYPVSGSDQDWYMHEHGTVALLLEGAYHNPELTIRTEAVAATRPVWQGLLERVDQGMRISGHVRDEAGKPVEAEVVIDQIDLRFGERWTARPRDGRFDRLMAKGGRYTVRARAAGYAEAEQEVRVGTRPVEVDLVLRRK